MSVKYKKVSQREHILIRPDTYVGSIEKEKSNMFCCKSLCDMKDKLSITEDNITFVPAFYKIFDEVMVNSRDASINDPLCNTIKVEYNMEENYIEVYNNGCGIEIRKHEKENIYIPELIFGVLLTSSNYDDTKKRTTGGKNGLGSKICNIFSSKFIVEVADIVNKKHYYQEMKDNMMIIDKPIIKTYKKKDGFVKIRFYPDFKRFGLKGLDKDHMKLFAKRCVDLAGMSPKLKVFFNGKRIKVDNYKKYMELYYNDAEMFFDNKTDRWQVGVLFQPDKGDKYISSVNGISTYLGGTHVNHVVDMIVNKIKAHILKKNKNLKVKNSSIKQHLVFFVDSVIENPSFSSQTKSTLVSKSSNFGSSYKINDNMMKKILKSGIVEYIVAITKMKEKMGMSKHDGKKKIKLRGIPKLEDANKAGSKDSYKCSLILTEGDSAKAFAMSGLGVIGRDYYGVFPLKGKLLNVRDAPLNKIQNNNEIQNLVKILGLKFNEDYSTDVKFKTLRYGKIISLCDQDVDGYHIKGLLINFIHNFWPSLIKRDFFTSLATPIVKAFKGKVEKAFYNLSDYNKWCEKIDNKKWKIKYYKGLGTSTAKEAKEYFKDIDTKLIHHDFNNSSDIKAIDLAFNKKLADKRKEWLKQYNKDNIIEYDMKEVKGEDFFNKEFIHFSNDDVARSIPSLVDGLKPSQRKILYGSFLRKLDKGEVKVAQLAGFVSDKAEYHHGEMSLQQAIVGMAQNFVGSNNINILKPNGQFGTRLSGNGKDSASARYIFTQLEDLTTIIFNKHDNPVLEKNYEDNVEVEPVVYCPIIPMILVNGAIGIGTGYSTDIPSHNPIEIINNLINMLGGKKAKSMRPYWRGFNGKVKKVSKNNYEVHGCYKVMKDNLHITEIPVGIGITKFKENLEKKIDADNNSKKESTLSHITDNGTEKIVDITLHYRKNKMKNDIDFTSKYNLVKKLATTNMHLYSCEGKIKKYKNVKEIMKEFYGYRLMMYVKRKDYMLNCLKEQLELLSNKVRFILMKLEGKIVIENKKKVVLVKCLKDFKFPLVDDKYDYLLGMPLWNLTYEKVKELQKQMKDKEKEYKTLNKKSAENIWLEELNLLKNKYMKWVKC